MFLSHIGRDKASRKKVKAIQDLEVPETLNQLKHFLGMVYFYGNMWRGSSHMIAPLTKLISIQDKKEFESHSLERHIQAFNLVTEYLARDVLLTYTNFSKQLHIHTDSNDYQLRLMITQYNKPIKF